MKTMSCLMGGGAIMFALASLVSAQNKVPGQKSPGGSAGPEMPQLSAPNPSGAKPTKIPVIGYLEGRGKVIILKAGAKGPVYSVAGTDGKLLFEDLSSEQLRAQAPEIHEFLKSAVAVNTRGPRSASDASLRVPQR